MRLSEAVQPFLDEEVQRYPLTLEGRVAATKEAVWRLLYFMKPAAGFRLNDNPSRVMSHEQRLEEARRMMSIDEKMWGMNGSRALGAINKNLESLRNECICPEEAAFRAALKPIDWSVPNPDPEVKDDLDSIAAVKAYIRSTTCVGQGVVSNNKDAMWDYFD